MRCASLTTPSSQIPQPQFSMTFCELARPCSSLEPNCWGPVCGTPIGGLDESNIIVSSCACFSCFSRLGYRSLQSSALQPCGCASSTMHVSAAKATTSFVPDRCLAWLRITHHHIFLGPSRNHIRVSRFSCPEALFPYQSYHGMKKSRRLTYCMPHPLYPGRSFSG